MVMPEPTAVPAEPEPQVDPDAPEPAAWSPAMHKYLDQLEVVKRARELMAGSTKETSGDDYPVALILLEGLEHALRGEFAADFVAATRRNTPSWDPHQS